MELNQVKKTSLAQNKLKTLVIPVSIGLLSCITLFLLFLILMKTQYFNLVKVEVSGIKVLAESDIKMLAEPYLGKSIFSDDMKMLQKRLEDISWVKDVTIKTKMPDTIQIRITERVPVALIVTREDLNYKTFSIDTNGFLIAEGNSLLITDLPVITGLDIQKLYTGETVKFKELNDVLCMLDSVRNTSYELFEAIKEVNMVNSFGLIRYHFIMTDWNIRISTVNLDEGIFHRVKLLLSQMEPENIYRISAYSNMLFVEEKRGNHNG